MVFYISIGIMSVSMMILLVMPETNVNKVGDASTTRHVGDDV